MSLKERIDFLSNSENYRVHDHTYIEYEVPVVFQDELENLIENKIKELEKKYTCDCDWCKEYGVWGIKK